MYKRKVYFLIVLFGITQVHIHGQRNTDIPAIDSLPINDWYVKTDSLSLTKSLMYSILIPGGAQYYGKHYVRAGFLTGMETFVVGLAISNQLTVMRKRDEISGYLDSARTSIHKMRREPANTEYFNDYNRYISNARSRIDVQMKLKDLRKSQIAWTLGLHFYGIMDGIEITNASHVQKQEKLKMSSAFWRGLAIPGWGQIYNGKYGKFGMLWMAIGSSVASAYFRQGMVDYFSKRIDISKQENNTNDLTRLENDLTIYRKSRNQYYWAMFLLYLYSIGDAVVDATLNDFDSPEKYAVLPGKYPMSLVFAYTF